MSYQLFFGNWQSNYCVLGYIENFEDDFMLTRGDSLAGAWPEDVSFRMDPDFPRQIALSDHLLNPENLIIASPALASFFKGVASLNLEYLPVTVYNHKGRVASDEYQIVHLINPQACIDTAASGVEWNSINPNWIDTVENLVIDESKIDPDVPLFRVKHLRDAIVIRDDLAEAIVDAGFTGIEFVEISEYES